jgi:hypothetical protein
MCIAPPCKRGYDEIPNALSDPSMAFRSFLHLRSHSIICLNFISQGSSRYHDWSDLSNTGAIISRETTMHSIGGCPNLTQTVAIYILSFGSHSCNDKDLFIFCHTLLKLAKEDAEAYG